MSSPGLRISEGMKVKKQNKAKIRVGSVVKSKVGELESWRISQGKKEEVGREKRYWSVSRVWWGRRSL